ncbi:helix-turn-helix transcriptional regulator [Desulfosporosinus sp. PR]|uniref:helix-turn-helix domain-containing protein n=1 Tax=Candidatus Desulfosporosinus nitrosoreducens TaxID=3401928 RepID=UPI0027F7170D|nr:helix-turn-helix transcriptional regulator [Desulfosporosinus sp. PR]MDQ7095006.1 helix-turn-helix transcriptional regulator [Desulfosporosinus sp. PR]
MRRDELVNVRKALGRTQKLVAIELGISEVYLRKIEAGECSPGRDLMYRIECYYSVDMRKLFSDIFLTSNDRKTIA